jgi:5-deoxy-D-glucuronate isomerase
MESGQCGNQGQFAVAVRIIRLCVGFTVQVRVNDGNAVDNVAMVKEADVRIVKHEYHNQKVTD